MSSSNKFLANTRIKNELKMLKKNPVYNCSAGPTNSDLFSWNATIIGPKDTPYENGCFNLKICFTSTYPNEPPQVRFVTKIYHPNIDSEGGICIDILKDKWSPIQNIRTILLSICSLLDDPNPDDPLVPYIAELYKKNKKKFINEAKTWTTIYATGLK